MKCFTGAIKRKVELSHGTDDEVYLELVDRWDSCISLIRCRYMVSHYSKVKVILWSCDLSAMPNFRQLVSMDVNYCKINIYLYLMVITCNNI